MGLDNRPDSKAIVPTNPPHVNRRNGEGCLEFRCLGSGARTRGGLRRFLLHVIQVSHDEEGRDAAEDVPQDIGTWRETQVGDPPDGLSDEGGCREKEPVAAGYPRSNGYLP